VGKGARTPTLCDLSELGRVRRAHALMDGRGRIRVGTALPHSRGEGAFLFRAFAHPTGSRGREDYFSSTTRLRSVPMPEISTSSTSPGFIQSGGLRRCPTPSGVPVAITSPGASGVKSEQKAMICGTE